MSRLGTIALLALAAASSVTTAVHAQQVYRIVGPDGKVTFSDRPPENTSRATSVNGKNVDDSAPAAGNGTLPYALQQVVNRFPVTLYTARDCTPCDNARSFLTTRGVPFTERTVDNNESIDALKTLSGNSSVPFATLGPQQRLNGFSDTEWGQYLDAAGYPKQSQLPSNYRRPPATPLATAKEVARPAAAPAPATNAPAAPAPGGLAPSGPTPSNPTGLVF